MDVIAGMWLIAAASSGGGDIPAWVYLFGVLLSGGIVGGVITYFGRKRETSGSSGTSDAATLWNAGEQIRKELRDELVGVRKEKSELAGKVDLLNTQMETLRDKHAECQHNEAALRERVSALEAAMERREAPTRRRST